MSLPCLISHFTRISVCLYLCAYTYIQMCVHIHAYICKVRCIYIYICIYIFIYTSAQAFSPALSDNLIQKNPKDTVIQPPLIIPFSIPFPAMTASENTTSERQDALKTSAQDPRTSIYGPEKWTTQEYSGAAHFCRIKCRNPDGMRGYIQRSLNYSLTSHYSQLAPSIW